MTTTLPFMVHENIIRTAPLEANELSQHTASTTTPIPPIIIPIEPILRQRTRAKSNARTLALS